MTLAHRRGVLAAKVQAARAHREIVEPAVGEHCAVITQPQVLAGDASASKAEFNVQLGSLVHLVHPVAEATPKVRRILAAGFLVGVLGRIDAGSLNGLLYRNITSGV